MSDITGIFVYLTTCVPLAKPLRNKKEKNKKQQQLKYTKNDNMMYCKPSQLFQAGVGGGRVEKEGGRATKKKITVCASM